MKIIITLSPKYQSRLNKELILYLSGGDHDAYLLDSFSELLWLEGVAVIQIEVFEGFQKDLLLILHST